MKRITDIMISIIKSEICHPNTLGADSFVLAPDEAQKLYALSKKHDVAHIIGNFLLKNKIPLTQETKEDFQKFTFHTLRKHELLNYELENVCDILENLKIDHIPLKGAIIRKLYPEEWLRSSRDIDILVQENDVESVVEHLINEHSFRKATENTHDISTFSPQGICVEIHYALVEDGIAKESSAILKSAWDFCEKAAESHYRHYMTDEMFYFYHIAHMAKHFENGGCGVKPFLDLWLLDRMDGIDKQKRDAILEKGGLLKFANSARNLSQIWFDSKEHDEISLMFEEFIIRGGSFGININRVSVQQQKNGGKIRYALSKIFTPYERLKHFYPIIKKHKWLTPVMQVRRWGKLIFCGHAKRSINELKYSGNISQNESEIMRNFLDNIGL